MSTTSVLLHPAVITALSAYGALSLLLVWAERRWASRLHNNAVTEWLSDHVWLPLARVVLLLVFIALAYPVLYGFDEAPALRELLAGGEHRLQHLINLLFVLSVLLPLLPVVGGVPGLVLPIQGIAAAALLFHWLSPALGVNGSLLPGWPAAGAILLWIYAGHRVANVAAQHLGSWLDARYEMRDWDKAVYELIILACQAPAILIYGLALGRQWAGH